MQSGHPQTCSRAHPKRCRGALQAPRISQPLTGPCKLLSYAPWTRKEAVARALGHRLTPQPQAARYSFSAPNGAMQIIELRPMDTKRSGRARLGARLHHSPKPRATLSQPLTGPCRLRAPFYRLFGAPISPKSRKKARSHAPWVLFLFIIIGTYIICLGEIGGSRRRNTAPNFSEPNNTDYDK